MSTTALAVRTQLEREATMPALPAIINTTVEAEALTAQIATVEGRIAQWEERLKEPKKKAYDAWKEWTKLETDICGEARKFCEQARDLIKMFLRRERLAAEAAERKRQEEERAQAEAQALADAQVLIDKSKETGDQAYAQLADAVIESVPEVVQAKPIETPKIGGLKSASTKRVAKVTSIRLLCAEIGLGKVPTSVIKDLNMKELLTHMKESGLTPAGVEWDTEDNIAVAKRPK